MKINKVFLSLIIIICGAFIFAGCSSNEEQKKDTASYNQNEEYAITNEEYAITYNLNEGIMVGASEKYTSETPDFDLPIPTKEGCVFLGWTGSNGITPKPFVTIQTGSTGAKDFTANWISINNVLELSNKQVTGLTAYGETIAELVLPNSVTSIGERAFLHNTNLNKIHIPNSVSSVGNFAFCGCTSLTQINIPNSITSINQEVFRGCTGLTQINIPDSVTFIGLGAFQGCANLSQIHIPEKVYSIRELAFAECANLAQITVDKYNHYYDSRNDCNAIIKTSTRALICGCKSTVIPNTVETIEQYAFEGCCNLTQVTIPNSVTTIEEQAFGNCTSLTQVIIPNSVTSIGAWTFSFCTSLAQITIPDSIVEIKQNIFNSCTSLTQITIPNSVTSIGLFAFCDCTNLSQINYDGTMLEWNRISKDTHWDVASGDYVVHCNDGNISK